MRYQKYINDLLNNTAIDDGDIHDASRAVLKIFVRAGYLKDGSLWMLDDNGSMVCSFLHDLHGETTKRFSPMDEQQVHCLMEELGKEPYIVLNSSRANAAYWLSNVDPVQHTLIIAPILHKKRIVGFLQGRRQNHQDDFDKDIIKFTCSLANILGRAILATQKNKLQHALKNANVELEKKILVRNQELKKTLQDLQNAQGHLVESEKMAALGQLVCGVAHEVNTPLGVAITSLSILGEEILRLKQAYETGELDESVFIRFIEQSIPAYDIANVNMQRAATLVQEFKKTSVDQSHLSLIKVELKGLIESVIESLAPIYSANQVDFVLDIPEDLTISTYSGSIDQILTNLINNTCIHGFSQSIQKQNLIYIKVFVQKDDFIIDYQDNGTGIDDVIAKDIFTPFFTTNRSNGGTGLGLSVIYNLITQKLSGDIRVIEQDASLGAHFQIRLPISPAITLTE